jgi:hypothetical protein
MRNLLFCLFLIALVSFRLSAQESIDGIFKSFQIGRVYYSDGYRPYECYGFGGCWSSYTLATSMLGFRLEKPLNNRLHINANLDFHFPHDWEELEDFETNAEKPTYDPNDPDYDIDKIRSYKRELEIRIKDRIVGGKITSHVKWYFKKNHQEQKIKGYLLTGLGLAYHRIKSQIIDPSLDKKLDLFEKMDLAPWNKKDNYTVTEGIFAPSFNICIGYEFRLKNNKTLIIEMLALSGAHNKINSPLNLIRRPIYQLSVGYTLF